MKTCKTCVHWRPVEGASLAAPGGRYGQCRSAAPEYSNSPRDVQDGAMSRAKWFAQKETPNGPDELKARREWPITHRGDGCGGHPSNAALAHVAFIEAVAALTADGGS